ncbi:class I SAM-dependent rRNA methyltransferase [Cytophagales bacterium LB-30]|uniref:Class I SAM-dependent rRNA methyltransferase n=1 Tax=Shiella aurantiaca TaxID=3058365 RepID=A0ABT8F0M7_9BACT|nr:class I SAM-dependent rRNA methyltransferase [Shiella aurantiaca]MDN4163982.1 class I SAM-dependent rRNA methyltransferase [Shiella aurantiaca]
MQVLPTVYLKKGKDAALKRFHHWVFSGAIQSDVTGLANGALVRVLNSAKEFLGIGHYQNGSIAIRIISFQEVAIDQVFWNGKIQKAYSLRQRLGLSESAETTTYRLVHAEGDELPGLIIDIYGQAAVIQAHSQGMHEAIPFISQALQNVLGAQLHTIYDKSAEALFSKEDKSQNTYLIQQENHQVVKEHGNAFYIDWEEGQKTGFFIDQRENRHLLGTYSQGKKVLNTFCYSGGFSVYALQAGASHVHSVDISEKAIALTNRNVQLNGFSEEQHSAIAADVMKYIKEVGNDYDVIVLDPPAFAKHLNARHNAVQAYKRLNSLALSRIKPGGILFTFSCSQVVDKTLFNHTIASAAMEAGRSIKILHHLHQPADHPVNIFHPETEYLKGLVLYVE